MSGRSFPERLGSCALVGGSRSLEGAGRAREIEEHESVVRVNRLPHPRHYSDVGSRTDVYFANSLNKWSHRAAKLEWEDGVEPKMRWCAHRAPHCRADDESDRTSPRAVLFEGAPFDEFWRVFEAGAAREAKAVAPRGRLAVAAAKDAIAAFAANETNHRRPFPEAHPVARQSHALHFFEHNLPAVPYAFDQRVDRRINDQVAAWGYASKPSGGLKAFLTLANLCDSITLFGFGGEWSLDGHAEIGHSFDVEHRFYDALHHLGHRGQSTAPQLSKKRAKTASKKRADAASKTRAEEFFADVYSDGDASSSSSSSKSIRHFFPTSIKADSPPGSRGAAKASVLRPYFDRFAERLACLARHGNITVVKS